MFDLQFFDLLTADITRFQSRDLLVATIAVGLGINIIYAVLTNNERCYRLSSVKMMERSFGRNMTRCLLFSLGGLCVFMGGYLVLQAANSRNKSAVQDRSSLFEHRTAISGFCLARTS